MGKEKLPFNIKIIMDFETLKFDLKYLASTTKYRAKVKTLSKPDCNACSESDPWCACVCWDDYNDEVKKLENEHIAEFLKILAQKSAKILIRCADFKPGKTYSERKILETLYDLDERSDRKISRQKNLSTCWDLYGMMRKDPFKSNLREHLESEYNIKVSPLFNYEIKKLEELGKECAWKIVTFSGLEFYHGDTWPGEEFAIEKLNEKLSEKITSAIFNDKYFQRSFRDELWDKYGIRISYDDSFIASHRKRMTPEEIKEAERQFFMAQWEREQERKKSGFYKWL